MQVPRSVEKYQSYGTNLKIHQSILEKIVLYRSNIYYMKRIRILSAAGISPVIQSDDPDDTFVTYISYERSASIFRQLNAKRSGKMATNDTYVANKSTVSNMYRSNTSNKNRQNISHNNKNINYGKNQGICTRMKPDQFGTYKLKTKCTYEACFPISMILECVIW